MRKHILYKAYILILCTVVFTSCDRNDDENFPPPEYNSPEIELTDNSAELGAGQLINISASINASVALTSLRVTEGNSVIDQINYDGARGTDTYSFLFQIPTDWLGTTRDINFLITDRLNQTDTATFSVTVSEIIPQYTIEDVTIEGQTYKEINGIINFNETLTNDNLYLLDGEVSVGQSTTLTIEPGTTIYGKDASSRLDVREFGMIVADGTAEDPIVFTSFNTAPGQSGNPAHGDWSGIQINGSGQGDNSGVIKYVRIEYGGSNDDTFQIQNVGDQTVIEYVQVFKSLDNAFRVNEGNVNIRYIIATDCEDAGIRFDDMWNGHGQFWVVNSISTSNAIEGRDESNTILSNITITGVGFNDSSQGPAGNGFRIRNNAKARIYNSVVTGVDRSIRFSDGSEAFTTTGENIFSNSASFSNDEDSGTGFHSSADLFNPTDGDYDPTFNNSIASFQIENSYVGTSTVNSREAGPLSSFFENVNYIGAVPADNDWTLGWTRNIDGNIRE
ncbi:hypothetical protein [Aquimarina celericrescens]|uniref:Right handed beta helix domain-containing protein n=1 Tax=Aquimarina celericrescens TaxID=1964542 RepID=A0ABW5AZ46_9FLAO|nr:hypothetical protein [Aquimarina celericrescens]